MNNTEGSGFINIRAAAKMLGVSPLTLRNWDKKKKLTALRPPINNYRVYRLEDIQGFLGKIENSDKPKKLRIDFVEEEETDLSNSNDDELRI